MKSQTAPLQLGIAFAVTVTSLLLPSPLGAGAIGANAIPSPTVVVQEYNISPTTTDASQPFALHLLSYSLSCGNNYPQTNVNVNGQTITLTFVTTLDSTVACPAVYMPYGPTFTVPALAAGTYTVQAAQVPACLFGVPTCEIAQPAPQFAGTLTVKPAGALWISPHSIASQMPTTLLAQSRAFACNEGFHNTQVTQQNLQLFLSFNYSQTKIACPASDTALRSVSFTLQPLLPGHYAVYWRPDSTCIGLGLACTGAYRDTAFDTLVVSGSSALLPGQGHARGAGARLGASPRATRAQEHLLNGRTTHWHAKEEL